MRSSTSEAISSVEAWVRLTSSVMCAVTRSRRASRSCSESTARSRLSAFTSATHISSRITLNGSAVISEPACREVRPPESSSAAASRPSSSAHSTRDHIGGFGCPPEASMSTTSEPESEEVTKKTATRTMPSTDSSWVAGNCSKMRNIDSSAVTSPRSPAPNHWRNRPLPPQIENQIMPTRVGTSSTPATNWRTVRPLEMRAMKTPTKGAQAIHQPQ